MCNILKFAENPENFQTQISFEFIDFNNYKTIWNCTKIGNFELRWLKPGMKWKKCHIIFLDCFFICIQKVAFGIEVGIEIHLDIAV